MPVRIIHVGTGSRGRHWIEIIRDYPDAVSVAFVDKDADALNEVRKRVGKTPASFHTDLDVALREVPADAVLITSPSFLHAEQAIQALEARLTVLTEKPFATKLDDTIEVINKAIAVGKQIIVAENYRFYPAERTIHEWLRHERLGRIATVVCVDRRNQPPSEQGPWVATMDYPQLMEIAVHHFDSFRYLFDRNATSITARAFNPEGSSYRSGAATEAMIEMEGNLRILYFGTLTANRYEYSLCIEGEKGSLWADRKRVWWRKKGGRFFVPIKLVKVPKGDELPYPRAGTVSLLNQLRDAVLLNKEAETSGADNYWTLSMVSAAMRSTQEGRAVAIREVATSQPQTNKITVGSTYLPHSQETKQKMLVIGWDAADAELIEQWCAEGLLPNIARMKSEGMWARLETTASTLHVSAWPSIFTGTAPDKHGLYHAYVARPGVQGPVRPRPDQTPFPFLWKLLSDHGKRCVIMDAFMTCPLQNLNGSQIVDWGSWSHFWETTITPPALKTEIERKFGAYPAEDHSRVGMVPPPDFEGFHQRLMAAVTKKTEVVKWLMNKGSWDLFVVVFGEAHPAGHYFWQFHDPSYLTHPPDVQALRNALRDIYVALDTSLGQILKSMDQATTVLLVSGDGMGPNYSGAHILTDLLVRMNLFTGSNPAAANSEPKSPAASKPAGKTDPLSLIRNMIPQSVRVAITKALLPRSVQEKLSLRWKTAGIAWNRTRAFLIENSNEGYIRINLKGREPEGIVEPGREYDDLCEEMYRTIKSLRNPANNAPAIRAVYKTDNIYTGPCRAHMPDIIVNWNDDARVTTELLAEKYGIARSKAPNCGVAPYYTGNHRPTAFMACLGADIVQRSICEGASTLDLAPTILKHFGIDPPEYMDGRVLDELRGSKQSPLIV